MGFEFRTRIYCEWNTQNIHSHDKRDKIDRWNQSMLKLTIVDIFVFFFSSSIDAYPENEITLK